MYHSPTHTTHRPAARAANEKPRKSKADHSAAELRCLVRATDGKRRISTALAPRELPRFHGLAGARRGAGADAARRGAGADAARARRGGAAAGLGVLAAAGLGVLVLEKGAFARAAELDFAEAAAASALYEAAGLLATQDGAVSVLAGATLGGGTRVNWSASWRTPDHVRREWAERAGLPAFAPGAPGFDAALDAVCARLDVRAGAQPHGAAPSALAAGLAALGADAEEVPRNCADAACAPGSHCHFGCRTGGKQDTVQTWLADAARDGARILTGAAAERVLLEAAPRGGERGRARCAVGVLALAVEEEGGAGAGTAPPLRVAILAPVVVAAAGAIHSPALLLRSGVSGGGRVGANLRLHPCALVVGLLPRGAPIPRFRAAPGDGGGPAAYAAARPWEGPIMSIVSKAAANWDAPEPADAYGSLLFTPAYTPALFGAAAPWTSGAAFKALAARGSDAVAVLVLARDAGAGRVALGRDGAPRLHYRLAPHDGAALGRGMALAARALAAAGADTVMTCLNAPGGEFAFPAGAAEAGAARAARPDFAEFVARVEATGAPHLRMPLLCAHQMGTCALGADAAASALDPSGESWEVAGLHCLDASLFPTPTGVNPMVTVEAAAWMLAGALAARAAAATAARGGGGGGAARRPAGELRYEAGT
jgi:long-chain-alcohol oxidase